MGKPRSTAQEEGGHEGDNEGFPSKVKRSSQGIISTLKLSKRFSERIFVFRCATEDLTVILPSEGRPTYIEGTPPDDNDGRTIIDLTDEESDVIHAYIDYLYEEEVDIELCKALRASGEDLNDVASIDLQHEFLAKLYVFGEKIHDKAFCDEVLDTIAQRIDEPDNHGDYHFPHPIATRIIYEGTPEDSPVRTMLVDLYAEVADAEWLVAGDRWSHPVQFLNDVLKRLLDARSPVAVWEFGVFRRRKEWHKRR